MNTKEYERYLYSRQQELCYDVVQLYKHLDTMKEPLDRARVNINIQTKLANLRDVTRGLEYVVKNAQRLDRK